jgi:hypothetical protein
MYQLVPVKEEWKTFLFLQQLIPYLEGSGSGSKTQKVGRKVKEQGSVFLGSCRVYLLQEKRARNLENFWRRLSWIHVNRNLWVRVVDCFMLRQELRRMEGRSGEKTERMQRIVRDSMSPNTNPSFIYCMCSYSAGAASRIKGKQK